METPQWWAWLAIVFIAEENADSGHQPEGSTDAIENYCVLKTDGKVKLIVTTCHIVIVKIELTRSSTVWPLLNLIVAWLAINTINSNIYYIPRSLKLADRRCLSGPQNSFNSEEGSVDAVVGYSIILVLSIFKAAHREMLGESVERVCVCQCPRKVTVKFFDNIRKTTLSRKFPRSSKWAEIDRIMS